MKGIEKMSMKAALTFACMNVKKLALTLSKRDKDGGTTPPDLSKKSLFHLLFNKFRLKKTNSPYFQVSLSTFCEIKDFYLSIVGHKNIFYDYE